MEKKSKRKKKKLNRVLLILASICMVSFAAFFLFLEQAVKPIEAENTQAISVQIPTGTSTREIADILKDNGLIRNTAVFRLESKAKGYDGRYKAGEYILSKDMSMLKLMEKIISGNVNTVRFTIPEGYTLKKIGEKLSEQGLINQELFIQELQSGEYNYEFLKYAPQGQFRLEGYLYPETYDVYTTASEQDIINRMLLQFDTVFKSEYYDRAKELGLNINEIITIASIIQGEAAKEDEMDLISSVIYNRLKIGMKLQVDATVQYVLDERTDRVTTKNTEVDSPYNTYQNFGLPPGPVCSPGKKAIEAALYPADTNYVYFVAKGDGYHAFTDDYDQFLKDKNAYIKKTFGE
ncbi:endolytic transglycosylase MltG [Sinanaerobacter sp. ZZT-01]|uniref:endolytic transglycosylase MltG n=1 Tax=Sinanaerobacter sp. ZZT-01 TaxID=3111540 RepID=UPI002D78632D|nr:endolytic transglycosylase MltG [Sinanaerobacter sp. ZZT-01]WRR93145.1 endolytic transglycosylase MltG [Sinanaerobacter sp. ZZT-01]